MKKLIVSLVAAAAVLVPVSAEAKAAPVRACVVVKVLDIHLELPCSDQDQPSTNRIDWD